MSQRKGAFFEDVGITLFDEELYDALYKTRNSSHFHRALETFNKPFNVKHVLDGMESKIIDLLVEFLEGTIFCLVEGFIHFDNVIDMGGIAKSFTIRRYNTLDE